MDITAQEKLMYSVMKSIYDSGIPISFKGSMVLKVCLLELGYKENTRHTVDIDANWNSDTAPTTAMMVDSIQKAVDNCGTDLIVESYREYGKGRSAGLEIKDKSTDEVIFTMDIDVNRPVSDTRIYEIADMKFRGFAPSQMMADKICAVSTDKVFRRIKDVIDLYYFSKVLSINHAEIIEITKNNGRKIEAFNGFLNRSEELKHSYEKFRIDGNVEKPEFEIVYDEVKNYLEDFLK